MSYTDPYAEDVDPWMLMSDPNLDPAMREAMLYAMMSGDPAYGDVNVPAFAGGQMGAMWNMVPDVQPGSGKALTVAQQNTATNAWRSGMFDTAFQGLGGMDAFSAEAFAPQITQNPVDSPINDYLRAPYSLEGMIASELREGGTASTAIRKLRTMLADETLDPAIRDNLLMELPAAFDPRTEEVMEILPDGTGVDWERGVREIATRIGDEWATMPPIGQRGPQYNAEGEQISAGGTIDWMQDPSTGAWTLVETTETLTPAAQTFQDLGLPSPADEYTAEDFMSPQTVAAQQLLPEMAGPVAEAMARMLAAAPTNRGAGGPVAELAGGGAYVPGVGAPDLDTNRYNFPTTLNEPAGPVVNAPGPSEVQTTVGQLLPHDPGAAEEWMRTVYPTLDRATQDSMVAYLTETGQADLIPAEPRSVMEQGGQQLTAPDVLPEDPGAIDEWMRMVYPTLNRADQDAVDAYLAATPDAGGAGGGGGRGRSRSLSGWRQGEEPPPEPIDWTTDLPTAAELNSLQIQPALEPTPVTPPAELIAQILGGYRPPPAYELGADETARQPGGPGTPRVTPAYELGADETARQPGGPGTPQVPLPPALTGAMLAKILGGGGGQAAGQPPGGGPFQGTPWYMQQGVPLPGGGYASPNIATSLSQPPGGGPPHGVPSSMAELVPDWPQQQLPSGQVMQTGPTPREDWMRAQIVTGAGGGRGSGAMPATPSWAAGGVGQQAMSDAMLAALLPSNQQRSTSLPSFDQQGAEPARQPGGTSYLQAVETGEQRAAQRAAQREVDAQQSQILGGTTDRTGKRVRPTRTPENARKFRAAMDDWHGALDQRNAVMQAGWGSPEFGPAVAQSIQLRRQGVRPLDQALMARRLVLMGAGMPSGAVPRA